MVKEVKTISAAIKLIKGHNESARLPCAIPGCHHLTCSLLECLLGSKQELLPAEWTGSLTRSALHMIQVHAAVSERHWDGLMYYNIQYGVHLLQFFL